MNKREIEKSLKRFLKRKVSYSFALLIAFIISGEVSLASEAVNAVKNSEVTETKLSEAKDLVSFFKIMRNKTVVQKSEDKSTQFFFNVWLEKRKAKKYADNGFKEWANENINPENPDIEIPDVISPIKPQIQDPESAIPNEDFIGTEPKFEFNNPVGAITMGDIPQDITINVSAPKVPVSEIKTGDFNIFDKDSISNPGNIGENVGGIENPPQLSTETNVQVQKPTVEYSGNITTFTPPEIPAVQVGTITAPAVFNIADVKISATGFNQGQGTKVYSNYTLGDKNENSTDPIVIQNYEKYHGNNFDVYFNKEQLHYNGNKIKLTNGNDTEEWGYHVSTAGFGRGLRNKFADDTKVATFISDIRDVDVELTGNYNIQYEGTRGADEGDDYIRIFLSSNPAGVVNKSYGGSSNKTIKITNFKGELNLSTTEEEGKKVGGNLIGLEHQTWDKWDQLDSEPQRGDYSGMNAESNFNRDHEDWEKRKEAFFDSYSVLINSGTINLGKGRPNSNGNEELAVMENSKNMIGIMIDLEESSGKEYKDQNNKTINAGNINIYGTNSIGISFEEYRNESNYNNGHFILRDDAYIGKINVEGKNNYGFKMGNIFNDGTKDEFNTYFDETKVIGNVDGNTITVKNDNETDTVLNYTSKISVSGTENIGMVVGKSLSANANTNPIANFENISIEVNGENNIGFVRDKDYSDNNKNDMVINDKNITDMSFGENATNSVLIRSEQYGITLDKELDVTPKGVQTTADNTDIPRNVVMQATAQSWDKDGNGNKDTNSAGKVTNKGTIKGTIDNMVGLMASGTLDLDVNAADNWQNKDLLEESEAINRGTISFEGANNIGIAVIDNNSGTLNEGEISIKGKNGIGVYNTGIFTSKVENQDKNNSIIVSGENTIGIYNEKTTNGTEGELNLADLEIEISEGATGIYSKGGQVTFNDKVKIVGGEKAEAGIYTEGDTILSGNVTVSNVTTGLVADNGTVNISSGNITYEGEGYALYAKENGKITFRGTGNKALTLVGKKDKNGNAVGNAYGVNIQLDKKGTDKVIDFAGANIDIKSNNVVVFDVINRGENSEITVSSSNFDGNNDINFKDYVGEYNITDSSKNYGYKLAAIDGGTVNLNEKDKNLSFLERYKFQRSDVNVSGNIDMALSSTNADKYFNGEVIGIGQSSSQNIKTGENQRAETTITISGATVTADRTEEADKSTIGAYIDYGEISLTGGNIIVEDDGKDTTTNAVNNNGVGVYGKNGSKITVDENSSVTVHGNNGVGIFAEATKKDEIKEGKNKFGGNITTLEISNAGNITLEGESGVGIYADNESKTEKATVSNTGTIKVGKAGSTKENSSVGIYGKNTVIENKGNIEIGCNHNQLSGNSHGSVGIYAEDSVVKVFGKTQDDKTQGDIYLGDYSTGVYVDENSTISAAEQVTDGELVFKNLKTTDGNGNEVTNSTTRTGIYFAKNEKEAADIIDFNVDMSSVDNGRVIVSDGRNVTLNSGKTIAVSGNGGRGIHVANAAATNKGNIIIDKTTVQNNGAAVGLLAADTNGTLNNSGTITVQGIEGIGIYAENDGTVKTGNTIENIGTINLGADKAIGVVAKNTDVTIENKDNISFVVTENNNGTTTTINATNSIGIYAEGGAVTNNKSEFTVTGNGKDKLEDKNIGIYLGSKASYKETEKGSIKVENGAVGIYADKGVSSLEKINITSDSKGVQTIGVALNGENKETKTISGNIELTNTTTDSSKVGGKNIGIYAKNSTVNIEAGKTLTLNYNESNGTGIYLDESTLSGDGTIQIKGIPNSLKISNSIGIYYSGNSSSGEHNVTLEIDKNNTIGIFASGESSFTRKAAINIGNDPDSSVKNITGIVVSDGAEATNAGTITLGNVIKGTGMAAVEGRTQIDTAHLTNSGNIVISEKAVSGTGVFLSGKSQFTGTAGAITINGEAKDNHLGIGIYALGKNAVINSTGKFDMAKGNAAVYSDGANISSDINLINNNGTYKNIGTTALVIKSDTNTTSTVGGTNDKMKITLAENSTGIYALDSGVKIDNVSIDATANTGKDKKDELSYGVYLAEDNGKTYEINNTDVSIVKGTGIVLSSSETAKTALNLTESNVKVNSYSEGAGGTDSAETGIGIYGGKGSTITLNGGNKLDLSYGTGIYSEKGTISIGAGTKTDTINLQGYSVGLYSKDGNIKLGTNTAVTFEKMTGSVETAGETKGAAAYSNGGSITSSANITGDKEANLNGFIALLGKDSTIENSGTITLTGEAVSGISAQGGEIINKGSINITDNKTTGGKAMSTGIYSDGASVDNNRGTINVNGASAGIAYTGTSELAVINAGDINVNNTLNIGVSLKGKAQDVTVGTISGGANNSSNLGVHINQFTGNISEIGAITLGDTSLGIYADNTTNTISRLGQITVGREGIGVAVTNGGKLTIEEENFTVNAGAGGTGIYIDTDSSLTVKSLAGVSIGEAGAVVHVNGGTLNLKETAGDIKLDNRIGIVLQNNGNITSEKGSISNMTVTNGGIGIVVKNGKSSIPNIFDSNSKITLGNGNQTNKLYSVGIYYQDAGNIGEVTQGNIQYEKDASHTIGTIFDNTYGTLKNSHIGMDNSINNSIGVMIKKDKQEDTDEAITFTAENDKKLIDVNGDHNIGILGQDSTIITRGDINVGNDPDSDNSVGVYLTGDNKGIKHTYTGEGNITVGSNSQGIYAKNYSVTQNGNITVTNGVGIAGIITDDYKGSSGIDFTGDITIAGDDKGNTVGIYGKGTNITANGNMAISGVDNIGIFSSEKGDISFTGKTVEIDGAGSIGIYKDTEVTESATESTEITISEGKWNLLGDKTIGIAARAGKDDEITITNSADMTLGAGAMGIYSVGKNTVTNSGDITVGEGIKGNGSENDTASIGIYMANRYGGTPEDYATGANAGTINAENKGAVGVQSAGYAGILNEQAGKINVSNNGTGMIATLGGAVINEGTITVTDSGVGMVADGNSSGRESIALNQGTITLNKTENYNSDDSMIGMAAYNGGAVINRGEITVNAGTGMYFDENSSFTNTGKIVLNDGIGVMGKGITVNDGGTIVVNGGTAVVDPDNITEENSQAGSIVADNINRVVYVNDNYAAVNGGILKTDFAVKLNNPTVEAVTGGFGFEGKDIEGDFVVNKKFALEGNGHSYYIKDFIKNNDVNLDVSGDTGRVFIGELVNDKDYSITKKPYSTLTAGNYFDTRDNALDNILVQGGQDADALKKLNYYLNSIKDISVFNSEAERTMGEIGGNIYANVQSRMQDINRAFDNSLDEMISSPNPAPVNDKFSMIYTNGKYENSNNQLVDYDYNITGLNYMREYEENTLNRKYGFNLGFAVSKFDFDDSGSEEDVYSLRTGVHHVKWFENGISLTSKAEVGYNRHSTDRKINLGYEKYDADSDFNSYHVSLDNKVRKVIFKGESTEVGAYTGLNLEYGRFDKIKEHDLADLKVKAGDYMSSKVFVGADAQNTQYLPNNWAVKFKGDIQYSYDFGENYDENRASINGSDYYSLMSEVETKGAVSGKIGVSFEKSDYMSISLEGDYTKDFERDEDYWRAGLRFTYKFNSEDAVAVLKNPSIFLESYFDFDSDKLKSEDVQAIRKTSETINQNKAQGILVIEGHTDSTGTEKYNQLLSEKRAASVENEFKKNLKENSNIEYDVKGYGETQPAVGNTTSQGRAKNRRVDVKLINR